VTLDVGRTVELVEAEPEEIEDEELGVTGTELFVLVEAESELRVQTSLHLQQLTSSQSRLLSRYVSFLGQKEVGVDLGSWKG
jgi:hypothetical protein